VSHYSVLAECNRCAAAAVVPVAESRGGQWEVSTGNLRIRSAFLNPANSSRATVQPTTNSSKIVVAILDTGVDAQHPDLKGNILGGVSFVGEDALNDQNGHGGCAVHGRCGKCIVAIPMGDCSDGRLLLGIHLQVLAGTVWMH
jgi:hypothetical protein